MADPDPEYDVVIVGLGPVGATLANLLGLADIKTLVLEKEAAAYHLPRAVHFDDEVMRIFQAIGLGEPVNAVTRINPGMRFVDARGRLLLDWPRPAGMSKMGWNSSYRFHQPDLETILRNGLDRFEHVHVKAHQVVEKIEPEEDRVAVFHGHRKTGTVTTTTGRYLVGCDGARSFVRRSMGSRMVDLGFREQWLVVDVELYGEKDALGDHTIQYCRPDRPATYVRGPGRRRRWEITVKDHEDPDQLVQPERVWSLLGDWLSREEASLERTAVYRFQSSIAERWRNGAMMIAGDAAHLMPPFMGQGMCAGIRDVSNLAWKLAECVAARRDGGDCSRLLDTYQTERQPHVREYIDTAVTLGGLINASGSLNDLEAAFRQPDGTVAMSSIAPKLGEGLSMPTGDFARTLCQQPILSDGSRLDDWIGSTAWALLHRFETADISACLDHARMAIKAISHRQDPAIEAVLDACQAGAILMRPDRYVFGTAASPEDLSRCMRRLENQLDRISGR